MPRVMLHGRGYEVTRDDDDLMDELYRRWGGEDLDEDDEEESDRLRDRSREFVLRGLGRLDGADSTPAVARVEVRQARAEAALSTLQRRVEWHLGQVQVRADQVEDELEAAAEVIEGKSLRRARGIDAGESEEARAKVEELEAELLRLTALQEAWLQVRADSEEILGQLGISRSSLLEDPAAAGPSPPPPVMRGGRVSTVEEVPFDAGELMGLQAVPPRRVTSVS